MCVTFPFFFLSFSFFAGTGSHYVVVVSLELSVLNRLAWNSEIRLLLLPLPLDFWD